MEKVDLQGHLAHGRSRARLFQIAKLSGAIGVKWTTTFFYTHVSKEPVTTNEKLFNCKLRETELKEKSLNHSIHTLWFLKNHEKRLQN